MIHPNFRESIYRPKSRSHRERIAEGNRAYQRRVRQGLALLKTDA